MKTKILKLSSIAFIAILSTGCGGGSDSKDTPTTLPTETFKTYNINVVDDAVEDATVEAVNCKNSKSLGKGKYTLECSTPPKYISAKGGFVDTNGDGKHDNNEVAMGLPLLLNLDSKLFDVNLSDIAVTPLSTLVANIKDKTELQNLANKLGIKVKDFNKNISQTNPQLFQKLNTLLIIAQSSGITDQLLLMQELRKEISASTATKLEDILTQSLTKLKNNEALKKAYGNVFISGFIDESQSFMKENDILNALSSEYSDNDGSKVFITGFIYDGIIKNAVITILDGTTEVGKAKSTEQGRWKISIDKSILETDKVLLFTGTAIDSNGDKILLKSAVTTQRLREVAKKRISIADAIDLVISNVTTAQVAILDKNDKDFTKKPDKLEENKNKIEIFQQEVLLKASAAIKAIIDGNAKISLQANTYSFILDNLAITNNKDDIVELNIDGKIEKDELEKQSDAIKKDAILSQQLFNIESEKPLARINGKSLYALQYNGSPLKKSYKKMIITDNTATESNYIVEGNQWKKTSTKVYTGKIIKDVFYFDTNTTTAPYAITLKEKKIAHSIKLNKDYTFDVLGKQLYQPFKEMDTKKVEIDLYAESFDVVTVFKGLTDAKIGKALPSDYVKLTEEEQNIILSNYLIQKVSEEPTPFNREETELTTAIETLENTDFETDDISKNLTTVKSTLANADKDDKDAQVGKALFSLAEVTNSPTIEKLIDVELDGSSIDVNDNLSTLLQGTDKLELALLSSITDLSETSMELVHETVLKLEDVNKTLGINFADESYNFSYKDANITNNQAKLLRVAVLNIAYQLEYLTAFNYVTLDDVKTRTTVMNGISAEYQNISANPLSVFTRPDVGALNPTIGEERLAHSKAILLEALNILNTVVATKEDNADIVNSIKDAQGRIAELKASLNGTALYKSEEKNDGVTVITYTNLSALYSASTALDLTHTIGHDFKYDTEYYYDYNTNKEYTSGSYNQAFSQFYNEAMAKEWVAKDGSKLAYVEGSMNYMHRPTLDIEAKTLPTGSSSHIPNVIKKIEIKESGEATITHTGDNVLKYLFNSLNIEKDYKNNSSSSFTYYINKEKNIIPDTTVRYGVDILYGNIKLLNPDPIQGQVTIEAEDGFTGQQCFAVDVYDTLGHYKVVRDCLYVNSNNPSSTNNSSIYDKAIALDKSQFPSDLRYSLYSSNLIEFKRTSNPNVITTYNYDKVLKTWSLKERINYTFEGNEFVADLGQDGSEDYRLKYLGSTTNIDDMNSEVQANIFSTGAVAYHFVIKRVDGNSNEFYHVNETGKNQFLNYLASQNSSNN